MTKAQQEAGLAALREAITLAGGHRQLAELISMKAGVPTSRPTIYAWQKTGVPVTRTRDVELATGIPAKRLRPDFFRSV